MNVQAAAFEILKGARTVPYVKEIAEKAVTAHLKSSQSCSYLFRDTLLPKLIAGVLHIVEGEWFIETRQ